MAASRGAEIEEAIEEPEEVTAEPSSRREAVDVEELSSDLDPGVVTAEPTPASIATDFLDATSFASHRERSPRRDIRVPPKARPRPSPSLLHAPSPG